MWDLWWTKWHWSKFSLSTSVSPANSHSTDCSTFIITIYHPAWYNGKISGRRTKWTQVSPYPKKLKKKMTYLAKVIDDKRYYKQNARLTYAIPETINNSFTLPGNGSNILCKNYKYLIQTADGLRKSLS
jgi:hypothetical protein